MNFRCTFEKLYSDRNSEDELDNPFFLYCKMSDLCGSSYEDRKKVLLYYKINKKLNIYYSIRKYGKRAVSELKKSYNLVSSLLSIESFEKILLLTLSVVGKIKDEKKSQVVVNSIVLTKEEHKKNTATIKR